MKEIGLSNGMVALVDDDDFERISAKHWTARQDKRSGKYYAVNGSHSMQREVMGLKPGDGYEVDHREPLETLNNQKYNLRVSTTAQNQMNRGRNKNNRSGYKGVSWHSNKQLWVAQIGIAGRIVFLGRFRTPEEAHRVYCEAAEKLHGEFARTA